MNYPIPEDTPINKTYSLRMMQIAKLSDLSTRLRKSQSDIVREAIDEYYESHKDEEFSDQPAQEV